MAFAYHMEALRKQHVIEKKNAALARIALKEADEIQRKTEHQRKKNTVKYEQEKLKEREREHYLKSMGKYGTKEKGYNNLIREDQNKITQKDLRHQEKVLRDSCLVMGRVNEYFLA